MNTEYLDAVGCGILWNKIKSMLGGKVDKTAGKGLSTEDFTTEEKEKLSGIASGANKYTLPRASTTTVGGVRVGTGLSVNSQGVLSLAGGDYITEQGNFGDWYYRKWNSGTAELYLSKSVSTGTGVVYNEELSFPPACEPLFGKKIFICVSNASPDVGIHALRTGQNKISIMIKKSGGQSFSSELVGYSLMAVGFWK